jgi:hypothetical protein
MLLLWRPDVFKYRAYLLTKAKPGDAWLLSLDARVSSECSPSRREGCELPEQCACVPRCG